MAIASVSEPKNPRAFLTLVPRLPILFSFTHRALIR